MKWLFILGFLSFLPARAQIVIGPGTLPTGQVNTPYLQQLAASGGTGPYTFAQLSGSLPPGSPAFSLSSAGVISGTPDGCDSLVANPSSPCPNATEPMNSIFTVLATDSLGATGTQTYTIGIYWNPAEASFLTAFAGYDANMLVGLNNPPPLLLGGHLSPANPVFRQPSTDNQSTWNAWVDGIHAAGATILNIEPDLECVFDNVASCLALYSGAVNYARSLGMSISLDPAFYNWQSCGGAGCSPAGPSTGLAADCQALIGHAINASPGTGVSDWYACVTTPIPALGMSAYQWMISHWLANGDRFVPVHEPTTMAARWGEGINPGGCSTEAHPPQSNGACSGLTTTTAGGSGNTCPGDWWINFLNPLFNPRTGLIPAWTASAGIGIRTGVTTFLTEDQYSPTYAVVFSNNLPASVDMGIDMYVFKPADLSVYESAISVANYYQHQVFIEEFAAQDWVESGAPATEPCAIKGCYSCDWQTSQSDQNFVAAFLAFAASHGELSASLFPAQILAGCSVSYPDNCNTWPVVAAASANFLSGNRSALSQKLASIMTPGAGGPATITKSAGDGQSTPVGQAFPTPLAVTVTDTTGTPVAGASVTFTVTPGATGASGVFSSTGPVLVATDQNGNATAPVLTANSVPGQFTVTAFVNALTAAFTLANLGYTFGASSTTVGSAAGNSTALLAGYGPWTATSNAPWLHLAAGSGSGGGSALIQFSYDANANPAVQTGTLTIAGLLFTVTQAGASYVPVYPVTMLVSSGLNNPRGVAVDGQGNVYIADTANNAVEQLSAANGQMTAFVSGLNAPAGVAVDGLGNLYIADTGNHAIEKFSAANQQLTTLVSGLSNPSGVATDGQGNVYFSDTGNNAIDEWNAASQQLTPLSGSGLSNPTGVAVDGPGNVYFADSGNNAIKERVVAGGQVTVLVSSGLNNPTGVAVDGQGNVYTADTGDNAIKQWNAGSQQVATLVSTGLSSPMGVAVDAQGNIYIADANNNAIKKLTPAYLALSAGSLSEPAQAGTDSVTAQVLPASIPLTAASDQSWLTITGIGGGAIGFSFQSNTSAASRTAHIAVLGLQVTVTQSADAPSSLTKCAGDGQSTPLGQPFAAALQVCLTDAGGNPLSGGPVMFSVTPGATGASGTFSANPPMPIPTNQGGSATAPMLTANGIGGTFTVTASVDALSVTFTLTNLVYTLGASSTLVGNTAGSGSVLLLASGAWTASSNAWWLQVSAGSTSGTGNALIQFSYGANANASAQTGTLTICGLTFTVTQAGASFTPIGLVTALVSSGLKAPQAVAVDGPGNVYIADSSDNAIKEWSVSTQQVSTLVSGLNDPGGVAVDSQGNVYIADRKDNAIKEWSVAAGQVTSLVSTGLNTPIGVAVDSQGNVYFSDAGHNAIKEWLAATTQVVTLVSSGLNVPQGVALDAQGNVYFADGKNNAIKEWSAAGNKVSTLVSSGLNTPYGVAVDGDGNVYFADAGNKAIKEWSPATLQVTTLVSTGLKAPSGVAVDGQGNVYISDTGDNAIEKYTAVYLSLGAASWNEGPPAGTGSIAAQVLPASTPLTATSNRSWLTITGTGGGAIGFSFQANTSVNSRTAQITVLGQAVTVTQNGDAPASIVRTAGNVQSTPVGQAFATALQVRVTDAAGNRVQGAGVTFKIVPGSKGAGGTFGSSPSMPILTANGYATAPTLTANSAAGTFTVTASVGTLTTSFSLTITSH